MGWGNEGLYPRWERCDGGERGVGLQEEGIVDECVEERGGMGEPGH